MTHWLVIIGKGLVVAVLAAFAAVAFVGLMGVFFEPAPESRADHWEAWAIMLSVALLGSLVVGLPVALLTFWLAGPQLIQSPNLLAQITFLAGIMLILAGYVVGDRAGAVLLGLPAVIAALTYGLLGWFWILRPLRNPLNNPPQEKEIA